ncbi:MAG: LysR family transcriptional regulator, partial [Paracoccus sp. (in: a-proteobacteria)]|nr:LysR family transcriptional regulator [Paracoccus sp. (in: a-proteobacteria)]
MNWDDLRIVSAVSRTHSYTKAARLLHIDETTVSRRLARLESTFGVTLFEAVNGQRLPTSACSAILGYLDSVEHEIGDIERMLQ